MIDKYFAEYTIIEVKHFKETLLQHMGNVMKYVAERTRHQRQYDRRVNKRQMHTQESKIDACKAIDDDLVIKESSETESEVQDDSSKPGKDTNVDDVNIRPIYDKEPMAKEQLTAKWNIFAIGQHHTEQPEIINEGRVDQYTEEYKYFAEYTIIEVKQFKETLLQHTGNVMKYVAERTRHQRQYDRRVNKRQMHTQESKIDACKAIDDDLVIKESSETESEVQDDSSKPGNDTDVDDVNIRPIYDKELMAKVQLTAKWNIFAIGQHHTKQPEIINEGRVDQYTEECQVISPLLNSSHDNQTTEYSKQSLESENILLKKNVAQFQKDFTRMEAHCIALKLKYQNQSLKLGQHGQILNETTNKAKIKKEIDVLETMNIELEHSVAKLF
nr:hypothetical protein [Tanacetum cinerariifolium]